MHPKFKSPYVGFTVEEIAKAEAGSYVIQLGGEFFDYQGNFTFTREAAERFYDELYTGLHEMLNDQRKIDKSEVLTTLLNLRISPLRFH